MDSLPESHPGAGPVLWCMGSLSPEVSTSCSSPDSRLTMLTSTWSSDSTSCTPCLARCIGRPWSWWVPAEHPHDPDIPPRKDPLGPSLCWGRFPRASLITASNREHIISLFCSGRDDGSCKDEGFGRPLYPQSTRRGCGGAHEAVGVPVTAAAILPLETTKEQGRGSYRAALSRRAVLPATWHCFHLTRCGV